MVDGSGGDVYPRDIDMLLLLNQLGAAHQEQGPARPAIRETIGRFAICRTLGSGGFAVVYEAIDEQAQRHVALKVPRFERWSSAEQRRFLLREATLNARVCHPHVVPVRGTGEDGGIVYLFAEICEGGSLDSWLENHPEPMSAHQAVRLVWVLADAVAAAHAAGVTHGDIKPGNILLAAPAGRLPLLSEVKPGEPDAIVWTALISDFGLAQASDDCGCGPTLPPLTQTRARVGTPGWMAPEQMDSGLGNVCPASDVYGLGLVLKRLVTGCSHFENRAETKATPAFFPHELEQVGDANVKVLEVLSAVCAKCLRKKPDDRYKDAAALRDDLERLLSGSPTISRLVSGTTISGFQPWRSIRGWLESSRGKSAVEG